MRVSLAITCFLLLLLLVPPLELDWEGFVLNPAPRDMLQVWRTRDFRSGLTSSSTCLTTTGIRRDLVDPTAEAETRAEPPLQVDANCPLAFRGWVAELCTRLGVAIRAPPILPLSACSLLLSSLPVAAQIVMDRFHHRQKHSDQTLYMASVS